MVLVGICLFWKFENRVVWSGNYGELPCFAVMDPFGGIVWLYNGFCWELPRFMRWVLLRELWRFTALSGRLCAKDAVILRKLLCFKDFVSVDLCRKVESGWK